MASYFPAIFIFVQTTIIIYILEFNEDIFIFISSILYPSFANLNIIFIICAELICFIVD